MMDGVPEVCRDSFVTLGDIAEKAQEGGGGTK